MPYQGLADHRLDEELTVRISKRDLLLIRSGLEELLQTYTRHEHMLEEIHAALARLPRVEVTAEAPAAPGPQ